MTDHATRRQMRLLKELKRMKDHPPHGIDMWSVSDSIDNFEAMIEGPENTPYQGGEFRLTISVPQEYPNIPPVIKFKTRIYHPNIDSQGRICLDSLKQEPLGSWKPAITLETVLIQIQLLLANPNEHDPLEIEIGKQYQQHRDQYEKEAKRMTELYAKPHVNDEGEIQSTSDTSDEID